MNRNTIGHRVERLNRRIEETEQMISRTLTKLLESKGLKDFNLAIGWEQYRDVLREGMNISIYTKNIEPFVATYNIDSSAWYLSGYYVDRNLTIEETHILPHEYEIVENALKELVEW